MLLRCGLVVAMAMPAAALPAAAQDDPLYPAAQCAAFWLGRDDHAKSSAYLDRDPSDPARAAAFRAAALRLSGDTAKVDAFIAEQRPLMALMMDALILGDTQSREVHDRLLQTCDDFGTDLPALATP